MPALFIGHGSPMNIILDNNYTRSLQNLGFNLPHPKAILVISAHWLTSGSYICDVAKPKTIYDFYGFPDVLYKIEYNSPGAPSIANAISNQIINPPIKCRSDWGLDHGAWAVLHHIFPKADIPVLEMSLDYNFNDWHPKSLEFHYQIGKQLQFLREQGVLIIGSGNLVHNLGIINFESMNATPFEWAKSFDNYVKENLENDNHQKLIHFEQAGESARLAVPYLDHYLPLIYIIALQQNEEYIRFVCEDIYHGSISMRSFIIG